MKKKTVLKDLRAKEAKLAAELADVRKQIRAEEARQASIQGNGLGEMMRRRYAELHPEANLDDLTPEEIFNLVLEDQKAKQTEEKKAPEAEEDESEELVLSDAPETVDNDEESVTDGPAGDCEQQTFRF